MLLGGAIYWLRRLPERRLQLGAMAAIVGLLALLALVGSTPWSLVLVLGAAFAVAAIPQPHRSRALPVAAVAGAIMYPFYFSHLFILPVFGAWPDVATGVYMLVFVMMAVGLNIVVGYAGLLDLGYVAFYATGAYTTAWFASQQFAGQKCPTKGVSVADCAQGLVPKTTFDFGSVGVLPGSGGLHVSIWLLLIAGRHHHGVLRDRDRPADTAAARRLPRDRDARLRRDPAADRAQRRQLLRHRLQPDERPQRDHADRLARFGNRLSDLTGGFLPSNYLQCCKANHLGHADPVD